MRIVSQKTKLLELKFDTLLFKKQSMIITLAECNVKRCMLYVIRLNDFVLHFNCVTFIKALYIMNTFFNTRVPV